MSEPILIAGSNQKWDVILGIVIGAGGVLAGAGFWDDLFPMSPVLILVGIALILLCSIVWTVRRVRRTWLFLGEDGFTLRDAGGDEELRDEDVFAMSLSNRKNYSNGVYQSTTRVFTVWVETHATRKIVMTTRVKPNEFDLLGELVRRIADRLRDEAGQTLESGHSVEGKGWKLERDTLVFPGKAGTESLPFSEITAADIYDHQVCVWKRGVDEPAARFPEAGENAWILLLLLQERIESDSGGSAPVDGLGRILFERRPSRVWAWIFWPIGIFCFLFAGLLLVGAFAAGHIELALASLVAAGVGAAIVAGAMVSRRRTFRCHEYGVHSVVWFRERRLRYTDVASFTCSATRMYVNGAYSGTAIHLNFGPAPEVESPEIRYSASVQNADDEIDMLRDHVSRVVAARMGRHLAEHQTVAWTDHITFDAEGLTYRPSGFLGRKEPISVPYAEMERYSIEDGQFHLWTHGKPKATISESVSQRNFFPGFMLLMMVLNPPAAQPETAASH